MSQSLHLAEKKKATVDKGNGKNSNDITTELNTKHVGSSGIGLGGGFLKGLRGLVGGLITSAGAVSPTSSSTTPRATKMTTSNKTDEVEDVASDTAFLHYEDEPKQHQPPENLKRMSTNAVAGGSPKFEKERLLSQTLTSGGNGDVHVRFECCDDSTDGDKEKGQQQQHYSENRVREGKSIFADDIPQPRTDLSNPFLTFVGDDAVHANEDSHGGAHRDAFFVNNERNKNGEPTPMIENRSPTSSPSKKHKNHVTSTNDNPFLRLSSGVLSASDEESIKGPHYAVRAFGSSLTNK